MILLCCGGTLIAEDVKLANGTVMKNVAVKVWPDGLAITPSGFAQTATKYPWNWIAPEDVKRFQDQNQKQVAAANREAKIAASGLVVPLRVLQIIKGGYLAELADGSGTILVVGSTEKIVDDLHISPTLYPTGRTYSYDTAIGTRKKVMVLADSVARAIDARERFSE